MNDLAIRKADVADAEMLAALSYKTFWDAFHDHPKNAPDDLAEYMRAAFNVGTLSKELRDANSIFLVAELNGREAGYAKVILGSREEGITAENPIELNRLYSVEEFIGKGVGARLMDECFRIGRENGCDAMWLGVWEYNPRARKFYEKFGFRYVGEHIFQLGSDPQTDLLMLKEI